MDYRMLGSLEAVHDGVAVDLGPHKQRTVLAVLLLHVNEIVPAERLIDRVWTERPPRTAAHSIQIYVSELRKILEPLAAAPVILTRVPGYVLDVDPDRIDERRFARLVDDGIRGLQNGDRGSGMTSLRSALALWRGPPLSDFTYEEFAQPHIRRLEALRLTALEELAAAELGDGRPQTALELVEIALAGDPLGERLRELQLMALYRSGRHAEALQTYRRFRIDLADELGLDPSPSLRHLQERILLHDPSLGAPVLGGAGAGPSPVRNPYKGLRAFGELDAGDFFGREALVSELMARLAEGARLLVLVGPSGSGKSSVALAGLVPRVRISPVPGSDPWQVATMQPGRHPIHRLDAALPPSTGASSWRLPESLRTEDSVVGIDGTIPTDAARLLLVIDQFEELFSLTEDGERSRFLRGLTDLATNPADRVRVILTLRADFYDRPLLDEGFGRVFVSGVVNVLPMSAGELEAAILRPAQAVGLDVEPMLVAELVGDASRRSGALPLLQHALAELVEHRSDSSLTLASYREIGGLEGLLSRRSEKLYAQFDDEHRQVTLQVFLRMIHPGGEEPATRRRAPVSELTSLDVNPVAVSHVLETFGRHRLLSFDRDPITGDATVEVAHEALLTGWDRLAGWVEDHQTDLRKHEALSSAIDEWAASGWQPDYLLSGTRLAEYETWALRTRLQLAADERAFLDAGMERRRSLQAKESAGAQQRRRLERRARTRSLALVVAIVVLVAAVTFGTLAFLANRPPEVVLILNTAPFPVGGALADGLDRGASDFGVRVDKVVSPSQRFEQAIRTASEDGADLVIAAAADCGDSAERVAPDFPDTMYVGFECPGDVPNVVYVRFATEQASFLAGAAAALKSETGIVGFVAGGDIPPLWPLQAGFEAGARSVDPTIDVRSVYLAQGETGFDREALAFQAAQRLYRRGTDVIYQAAGTSGSGVFDAAVQGSERLGRQLWAIGSDTDQYRALDPGDPWRAHILTSMVKGYDRAVYTLVEDYARGMLSPGDHWFELANGGVGLAFSGGFIDDIRPQLDELRQMIVDGRIDVPAIPPDRLDEAEALGIIPEPSPG